MGSCYFNDIIAEDNINMDITIRNIEDIQQKQCNVKKDKWG